MRNFLIDYFQYTHVTFMCPMRFNRFPLDEHICKFEVGSTSLDDTRMVFNNHKLDYDPEGGNTILDYKVDINELKLADRTLQYVDSNYSLCGFEMKLVRNSAKYVLFCHTGAKIRNLSKNSHFENLIFDKIHIFEILIFTKFTFAKSPFSQNSQNSHFHNE